MTSQKKYFPIRIIAVIIFILITLDWMTLNSPFHPLFDVNREYNIPSWFSTVLLFSTALSAIATQLLGRGVSSIIFKYYWGILSAGYFFFSIDEMIGFHEKSWFIFISTNIEPKYHWYYLYLPFALIFFVYTISYFRVEFPLGSEIQKWLIGGMLVSLASIGFEILWDINLNIASEQLIRLLIRIEETLEMAGATMILQSCWLTLSNSISFVKDSR